MSPSTIRGLLVHSCALNERRYHHVSPHTQIRISNSLSPVRFLWIETLKLCVGKAKRFHHVPSYPNSNLKYRETVHYLWIASQAMRSEKGATITTSPYAHHRQILTSVSPLTTICGFPLVCCALLEVEGAVITNSNLNFSELGHHRWIASQYVC